MTKRGHKSYSEFLEDWNLTEAEAKATVYDLTKERWILKRKVLFYDIAIQNILETLIDSSASNIEKDQMMTDIRKILENLSDRLKNHARW